jgi:DNA-binding NtrC family response regulator
VPQAPHILLVDDDAAVREVVGFQLSEAGYRVTSAADGLQAQARVTADPDSIGMVLSDVRMPGLDGLGLLRWLKGHHPEIPVVLVSAFSDVDCVVQAMQDGAADYLTKPVRQSELVVRVQRCFEGRRVRDENERLRRDLSGGSLGRLLGSSGPMVALRRLIQRIAASEATILIQGQSGTGKELVARSLHELSDRAAKPFVSVNCGAIPSELLESELFGHERGAFTGASSRHVGRLERAAGGTLFLDEVAELPLAQQVKLLRVLQERRFERVGGTAELEADLRILAATHHDLRSEVEAGRFREDLYYRLAVLPIDLPSLRDRTGDMSVLSRHFARQYGGPAVRVDDALIAALERHDWPGNVRELQNVMQRLVLLRQNDQLTARDFVPSGGPRSASSVVVPGQLSLPGQGFSLPALERELILKALAMHQGNQSATARYLQIPRHVLLYRLARYEADPQESPG